MKCPEDLNHIRKLIEAVSRSDETAFKEFCGIFYELMYRFLWQKTRDGEASKDLTQILFLNVWRNRNGLDANRSIKAYLYRSANNLAINHLKSKVTRRKYIEENPDIDLIDIKAESDDLKEAIDDALNVLPDAQRTVFILNKFEGFKYAEIAETLEISIKTVESRMSKTLKFLREKLRHLLICLIFFDFFS